MIAYTTDLTPHGNYFAEGAYLEQDLAAGLLRNRAGTRMLALSDDFLLATLNTLQEKLGNDAERVIKSMGRDWGQRAAQQFAVEMELFYGRPLMQMPLATFVACLTEAFRHHGWGAFAFDLSRYPRGLLAVEVSDPIIGGSVQPSNAPVEGLLAAFLGGMFSHFANLELDCLQTECRSRGATVSRFVLTVPERLRSAEPLVADGKPHDEIVAELMKT